jgi:hypothetical protein
MLIQAILVRVRATQRDQYDRTGITIIFSSDFGDITRTFNLPSSYKPKSAIFTFLKASMKEKLPLGLLDKPQLFSLTIEERLKNMPFELRVEDSGNSRHPYNVLEIKPILTSKSSYNTQVQQ